MRQENLSSRALELIRSEITSGRLAPGTMVSASQLAERFGVSRTPVRDALLQLESAGMVRIEKNRGATIMATTLDDLIEVFQIRLMLEVPAAGRAAQLRTSAQMVSIRECFVSMEEAAGDPDLLLLLDRDLHSTIASVSGNQRLVSQLTDLRNLVLTRGVGTTSQARTGCELVEDHRGIVEAIERGDPAAAAAEMRRHVANTAELLILQEAAGDDRYDAAWVERQLNWL